jgi:hypothetical protein
MIKSLRKAAIRAGGNDMIDVVVVEQAVTVGSKVVAARHVLFFE